MSKTARRRHRGKARELAELQRNDPAGFLREWKRLEGEWLRETSKRAQNYTGQRAFGLGDVAARILNELSNDKPETKIACSTVSVLVSHAAKVVAGEWRETILLDDRIHSLMWEHPEKGGELFNRRQLGQEGR